MSKPRARERPILFSGPMVKAILDGRKTQTRRVVKPQPERCRECANGSIVAYARGGWTGSSRVAHTFSCGACRGSGWSKPLPRCPYGVPGDLLWVRETWCYAADPVTSKTTDRVLYRATDSCDFLDDGDVYPVENKDGALRSPWHPSIHMPRAASRLTLRVLDVRVQRLQEISEEDAQAEGCGGYVTGHGLVSASELAVDPGYWHPHFYRSGFEDGWDALNAKRGYGWDVNPWVWAITFEREPAP